MPIELHRVDDRLIHGQVIVGWGHPLGVRFIVLVDDAVAASPWEQELHRLATPPEMEVHFAALDDAVRQWAAWDADPRPGILLTGTVDAMCRLADQVSAIRAVNLGGVHQGAGRRELLRYLYLTPEEERALAELDARGVTVTARDVPSARPVAIRDLIGARGVA